MVTPAGRPENVRLTVPVNPCRYVTLIVCPSAVPCRSANIVVARLIEKSPVGGGGGGGCWFSEDPPPQALKNRQEDTRAVAQARVPGNTNSIRMIIESLSLLLHLSSTRDNKI